METLKLAGDENEPLGEYLICTRCGERVERGALNVSEHYIKCPKRNVNYVSYNEESIKTAWKWLKESFKNQNHDRN